MCLSLGYDFYDVTHHFPSANSCHSEHLTMLKNQNIILQCVQWPLAVWLLKSERVKWTYNSAITFSILTIIKTSIIITTIDTCFLSIVSKQKRPELEFWPEPLTIVQTGKGFQHSSSHIRQKFLQKIKGNWVRTEIIYTKKGNMLIKWNLLKQKVCTGL